MLPCWSRSLPQSDSRGRHRPWGALRCSAAGRHRWLLHRRARRLTCVCVAMCLCPGSAARAAFVLASLSSCCAMLSCPLRPRERPGTHRHAQTHRHTFSCSSSASPGTALQACSRPGCRSLPAGSPVLWGCWQLPMLLPARAGGAAGGTGWGWARAMGGSLRVLDRLQHGMVPPPPSAPRSRCWPRCGDARGAQPCGGSSTALLPPPPRAPRALAPPGHCCVPGGTGMALGALSPWPGRQQRAGRGLKSHWEELPGRRQPCGTVTNLAAASVGSVLSSMPQLSIRVPSLRP